MLGLEPRPILLFNILCNLLTCLLYTSCSLAFATRQTVLDFFFCILGLDESSLDEESTVKQNANNTWTDSAHDEASLSSDEGTSASDTEDNAHEGIPLDCMLHDTVFTLQVTLEF